MTIPANANTNRTTIMNQIVTELQTVSGMNSANVFMCARPIFLQNPPGDRYIEVVPGSAIDKGQKQGFGWVDDSVSVCIFWRLFADQEQRDTVRLADSSNGLMQFVTTVEQKLFESFLAGNALVPMLGKNTEAGEGNPEDPYDGWVMITRNFGTQWLHSMPGPHSTSAPVASQITAVAAAGSMLVLVQFDGTASVGSVVFNGTGSFEFDGVDADPSSATASQYSSTSILVGGTAITTDPLGKSVTTTTAFLSGVAAFSGTCGS